MPTGFRGSIYPIDSMVVAGDIGAFGAFVACCDVYPAIQWSRFVEANRQ